MNFAARRQKLLDLAEKQGIGSLLIQNLDSIYYLSGFNAAVASRPFALIINGDKNILVTPMTSADTAREETKGSVDISIYYEHPVGEDHSFSYLTNIKQGLAGVHGVLGVESGRLTHVELAELAGLSCEIKDVSAMLMNMRSVKEPEELVATRVSAKYMDFVLGATLDMLAPGVSELEISQASTFALFKQAAKDLPGAMPGIFTLTTSGPDRTALPHTNTGMRTIVPGDGVILCRQVSIDGYRAQSDRLGFLGRHTPEQAKYYQIALDAHNAALEIIRPGIGAADIDKRIREVYAQHGLEKYFVHRSGSGLGISIAEPPYLRFDSKERIEENMVLVLQPAIYLPGIGGFRRTDSVIVTADGCELITNYPSNIASLTISIS